MAWEGSCVSRDPAIPDREGTVILLEKFKIRTISNWSILLAVGLSALCVILSFSGLRKYALLRSATQDYMAGETAAQKLQAGSDTLTRQARLAAATGEQTYIDAYFQEANVTRSRERALDELSSLRGDPEAIRPLQQALDASVELMQTEYYAMRLVETAGHIPSSQWPEEIRAAVLTEEDASLSDERMMERAQTILIGPEYEDAKAEITADIAAALAMLTDSLVERQYHAAEVFTGIFRTMISCVVIFAVIMLLDCAIIRRGIVRPLLEYDESIRHGLISPIHGVEELQTLARTYNSIYQENEEREMLMKRQAEHDPLTELLNRGSFDRILSLYEKDQSSFALILADVDTFKSVNDTYGHMVGDLTLKKAASALKTAFRSVDYVCRIGGDEFAVIMVDMTPELYYTITDKIGEVNRQLAQPEDGLPAVSLSVGVAFSNQPDSGENLFRCADSALYYTKAHGRRGCSLYPMSGGA